MKSLKSAENKAYIIDRFIRQSTLQMTGQVEDRFCDFDVRLPTKQSFFDVILLIWHFFLVFFQKSVAFRHQEQHFGFPAMSGMVYESVKCAHFSLFFNFLHPEMYKIT